MHKMRARTVFLFLGGVLAAGSVILAWAVTSGSSEAQEGAMHNCPQPGNWAISVWSGDDETDAEHAFATCAGGVAAAYHIDPQTQAWSRWFAGQPGLSTLSTLNDMQGVLSLGSAPASTPTPTPTAIALSGERLVFLSDRDANSEIYVMNTDGSGQTNLTNNPASDWSPHWSPDGSRIAFTSDRDGDTEIYLINPNGSNVTKLTDNAWEDDCCASWSPDGSKIAFISNRAFPNDEIFVMNADGTGQTQLTHGESFLGGYAWSPDGTKIAFDAHTDLIGLDIYVVNADGSGRARLTDNPEPEWAPADWFGDWSPDGSKIAWWRYSVTRDIWVMNADGTDKRNLTPAYESMDTAPVWSPDGSKIAFDCAADICVMNADGTGQAPLTSDSAMNSVCGWSPDGSKIAFVSQRDFHTDERDYTGKEIYTWEDTHREIYVMNADGSDVKRLTNNYAWEGCPAWQP